MFTNIRSLFPRFFKKIEIQSEDQVELKPVFGIRPGIYLGALYGAFILCIFFLIFFFPGIQKPGALGVFHSEPSGAAVRVDGITMGSTPCEVFIPRGKHTLSFVLPGFTGDGQDITVKGRIFGSAFFPSRLFFSGTLSAPDPREAFTLSARDYIRWSFTGEPTEMYQIPQSLSEGAYRIGPAATDPWVKKSLEEVLELCLPYAAYKASVRDMLRAKILLDNHGLSPSPLSLLQSIGDVSRRIGQSPAAAPWLAEMVPGRTGIIEDSSWAAGGTLKEGAPEEDASSRTARLSGDLSAGGLRFIAAASGGDPRDGPLYVAQAPVSREAWDAFTAENPRWAEENRDVLIGEGLVQEEYLAPVDDPRYPLPAAPGISWYAAVAYCRWLSSKLPAGFSGWEVRLPSEAEWNNLVLYIKEQDQLEAFSFGKLWEWCADPYVPLEFFSSPLRAWSFPADLDFMDRSLRGGSWINPGSPQSLDPTLRGSLPPETSSPFTGFRPVIARRRNDTPISLWKP
ncbi:MAG: SUMF1/EgtB/PvdO family nonheme iron enzyme [Spirochaetaceae bacterium]|jgi:hypothetical protein|nr:SUMF1/EgtB/PvdO family nonheme iron enzyme [Spirochaetaceae bacterium]